MSILNMSFNQLLSHLVVCTNEGYIIYSLSPTLEKKICVKKNGGVGIVKMFYRSNLCLLVGGGERPFKPRDVVTLWDDNLKSDQIEISFQKQIENILIDHERTIIIVLQKEILVFNFDGTLINSKQTFNNDKGLCAISVNDGKQIIVTLGTKKGEIAIWKINQDIYKTIQAHQSNIDVIAINKQGTLVATASETGTLIKIFNVDTGKQLYEFRRGTTNAKIYDICFNTTSTMLACCSSNGTIHIFELYKDIKESKNVQSTLAGFKDYLPQYFSSQWSFKQIYINSTDKMICGFDDNNILHICCIDGKYYKISGKQYDIIKQSDLCIDNK